MNDAEYLRLLSQLGVLCGAIRDMPLEDALEVIEATEAQKGIHRPTAEQIKNMDATKTIIVAALELKKVAVQHAAKESDAPRLILPGSPGWQ